MIASAMFGTGFVFALLTVILGLISLDTSKRWPGPAALAALVWATVFIIAAIWLTAFGI